MKFFTTFIAVFITTLSVYGQRSIAQTLDQFNRNSIPYAQAEELSSNTKIILLDARELKEYQISHLPNAIWVGYNTFDITKVVSKLPNKKQEIVVYCSVGVRSEDIAENLKTKGYSNVKNLYGGIFEWKNKGNIVVDTLGNPTEKVHAYSKQWARLLTNGEKILN